MTQAAFVVHVAAVDTRHGTNLYASATREGLDAQLAAFAREWWSEAFEGEAAPEEGMTDSEVYQAYFENHSDEWMVTDTCALADVAAQPATPN